MMNDFTFVLKMSQEFASVLLGRIFLLCFYVLENIAHSLSGIIDTPVFDF